MAFYLFLTVDDGEAAFNLFCLVLPESGMPASTLALLVVLVLADDTENTRALHDAAVVAHSFH